MTSTLVDRDDQVPRLRPLPGEQVVLPDAQEVDAIISVADVQFADLMFTARNSPLQQLCTRAGEPFRHVGLVCDGPEGPSIVEVGGSMFTIRPLALVLDTNDLVAVARLPVQAIQHAVAATAWCQDHAGVEQIYAWPDVVLGGFIAATRRFARDEDEQALARAIDSATDELRRHPIGSGQVPYSCSAFIAEAFRQVGYPLIGDLRQGRAGRERPSLWELVRGGPRPLRNTPPLHDGQVAAIVRSLIAGALGLTGMRHRPPVGDLTRWASPGDLWRSRLVERRYLVRPD